MALKARDCLRIAMPAKNCSATWASASSEKRRLLITRLSDASKGFGCMRVVKVISAGLVVALAVWLWWYWDATSVAAQSGTVAWSEPIRLSNPEFQAWAPAIVSDMAGNVHVMWSQTMTENPPPAEGDTLFYARWDGQQWSEPRDVLVSPEGGAEFPDLAVTPDGTLHAVWGTGGTGSKLMYARAPACCANDARNWSQPISLGMPVNLTTALVADERGRLHAAFASLETGNIVYRRSDDGGITWPVWVDIPGGMHQNDEFTVYPRLAVDGRGRVHAAWTVRPWPGRLVMYARSDDGGDTWNEPQMIDSADRADYAAGYGPYLIDVETYGEDEVHLIWDGAPTVERNHIWSSDGGNTWSGPDLLFPEITGVGRSGWNDMVMDSASTLHAVSIGGPLHASWSETAWSHSTDIAQQQYEGVGEWMRIALSLGNQLHVVWNDKNNQPFSVWYVSGEIVEAPAIAAQPLPTAMTTPTLVAAPTVAASPVTELVTPTVGVQPDLDNNGLPDNTTLPNPGEALLIGLIPALLIVGIVFVVSIWRARQ